MTVAATRNHRTCGSRHHAASQRSVSRLPPTPGSEADGFVIVKLVHFFGRDFIELLVVKSSR
jgi:hypothetical protein